MNNEQVTDKQVDEIFRNVDESKLGEWEQKFVISTRTWWLKNRKLSDKQKKRLVEIGKKNAQPRRA